MTYETTTELDYDARYIVDGWSGIAFYIRPLMIVDRFDDEEPTGYDYPSNDQVIAVMVGDDREHTVDASDLTLIDDDDYCHECGQLGCCHDGRER